MLCFLEGENRLEDLLKAWKSKFTEAFWVSFWMLSASFQLLISVLAQALLLTTSMVDAFSRSESFIRAIRASPPEALTDSPGMLCIVFMLRPCLIMTALFQSFTF
jgi:hypothetical protein